MLNANQGKKEGTMKKKTTTKAKKTTRKTHKPKMTMTITFTFTRKNNSFEADVVTHKMNPFMCLLASDVAKETAYKMSDELNK